MPYNFREYDLKQPYLLPPSIEEWVAEDSLPRFVNQVVEQLHERKRLEMIFEKYRSDGWGRAAYHPLLMLKVLLYAYCIGVTSSRKIARALENDVGFRFLSGNQQPDFRTISDFRQKHLENFDRLFVEVLELCKEAGMVKLGRVALDGRRVQCNADRKQNRQREALMKEKEALEKAVREILAEAERVDREEDEIYADMRGDELPKNLRSAKDRAKRIQECLDRIEAKRQKEVEEYEQSRKRHEEAEKIGGKRGRPPIHPEDRKLYRTPLANPTDPESRMMKMEAGYWVQAYNGQAAADCDSQVIVGYGLTNQHNDLQQLEPMLEAIEKQSGGVPKQLLADAGYWSEANLRYSESRTELFVPGAKRWKLPRHKKAPRGRIPKSASIQERMSRKMLTQRGRKIYKSRAPIIEGVFGQMWTRGLLRFGLRGLKKVKSEWSLWCLSHNVLKLYRSEWTPSPS